MNIRDRIKSLRRVRAADLVPNPRNWRTHPDAQRDALRGILAEIGIADAVLARELGDGKLQLIDGHLRAETMPEQKIPVLVLDLSEEEADKLMTVLDPLAAMAETDKDQLGRLLAQYQTESPAVRAMLDRMAKEAVIDLFEATPKDSGGSAGDADKGETGLIECPECHHRFSL